MRVKVPDTDENSSNCICGQCPTYPGDEPWLYCSRGKSPQALERKGCLCPGCPVQIKYDLDRTYYCMEGAAE